MAPIPLEKHVEFDQKSDGFATFIWDAACVVWVHFGVSTRIGRLAERVAHTTNGMHVFEDMAWDDGYRDLHVLFDTPRSERKPNMFMPDLNHARRRIPRKLELQVHDRMAEEFLVWRAYLAEVRDTYTLSRSRWNSTVQRFTKTIRNYDKLRFQLHTLALGEHGSSRYLGHGEAIPVCKEKKARAEVVLPFPVRGEMILEYLRERTGLVCGHGRIEQLAAHLVEHYEWSGPLSANVFGERLPKDQSLRAALARSIRTELESLEERGLVQRIWNSDRWEVPDHPIPPRPLPPTRLNAWTRVGDDAPPTPETQEEARVILEALLGMYPMLNYHGYGLRGILHEPIEQEQERLRESRQEMFKHLDEFMRACQWLEDVVRTKAPRESSYHLKHIAEKVTGGYISDGMMTAAGLYKRIAYDEHGFAISKKWTRRQEALARGAGGWSPPDPRTTVWSHLIEDADS